MTDEEPGLLGNLPRSRPGTRSDKRGGDGGSEPAAKRTQAAKPAKKGATTAKAKPASKAKAKPAAARKAGAGTAKAGAARPRKPAPTTPRKPAPAAQATPVRESPQTDPPSQSRPPSPGPLESAVKVAGAGLRVAEGVTREVLRRLPRP